MSLDPSEPQGRRDAAPSNVPSTARVAYRIQLHGLVQGIGYRPELARLASSLNLRGTVANTASGIEVRISGDENAVQAFIERCESLCPREGQVARKQVERINDSLPSGFTILTAADAGQLATQVPLDRVTCRECLHDSRSKSNPRFGYFLLSCSRCGPRYSILDVMPYERHLTSMKEYSLCSNCQREYSDPLDRRFHAQTTCCAKCGPQLIGLESARVQLQAGQVVALQGVGGYQFLCRLDSRIGIEHLRKIKQREAKPFAVMVRNLEQASHLVRLCDVSIQALESNAGPIVVAPQKASTDFAWDMINPGLTSLGVMLPTTALHDHLVEAAGPLIVTSANVEGDPLAYREWDKAHWSEQCVSAVVTHDRAILRPVDDSVVRVISGKVATIRAARGLAPWSLDFGRLNPRQHILAVGGAQKVAVALSNGQQAILGPHIGDVASSVARERFNESVHQLMQFYGCEPTVVVHDSHPDYFTTRWAKQFASQRGIQAFAVQHHVAHAASSLVEPRWFERQVTALTWDGTGLGEDGTVWGGEGFVYHNDEYSRVCRLRRFLLPGGEAAIKQPWRIAAGLLHLIRKSDPNFTFQIEQAATLDPLFRSNHHGVVTSSMGRLFDAAAVLIMRSVLPKGDVAYEGQYAALLEAHADSNEPHEYPLPLEVVPSLMSAVDVFGNPSPTRDPRQTDTSPSTPHTWSETDTKSTALQFEWNWEPLVRAIVADHLSQVPSPCIAMRYHRALAAAVAVLVSTTNTRALSLSGGVFQNKLLVELIAENLRGHAVELASPGMIPVNDGGLAVGQLLVAAQRMASCSLPH